MFRFWAAKYLTCFGLHDREARTVQVAESNESSFVFVSDGSSRDETSSGLMRWTFVSGFTVQIWKSTPTVMFGSFRQVATRWLEDGRSIEGLKALGQGFWNQESQEGLVLGENR